MVHVPVQWSELAKSLHHCSDEMDIHVPDGSLLHRPSVSIRRLLVSEGTSLAGSRSWHLTDILWYT